MKPFDGESDGFYKATKEQLDAAQAELGTAVEFVLIKRVEEIDGKVPCKKEIKHNSVTIIDPDDAYGTIYYKKIPIINIIFPHVTHKIDATDNKCVIVVKYFLQEIEQGNPLELPVFLPYVTKGS